MAITITKQPTSKAGFTGDTVVFAVEATGDGLTYQWQANIPGNAAWTNASGNNGSGTTATMEQTLKRWNSGYRFRCKITDTLGNVLYTIVVTITALDVTPANGLLSSETVTEIGNAIRETAGISARMLPTEMPDAIRSIGGRPIYTGYFVGGGGNSATYSLGVSLPEYDNYSFIVMPVDTNEYYCGAKMVLGNFVIDYLRTVASLSLDGWNIDFANGTIQHQFFNPGNASYKWWYFEEYVTE